jgi:hypothetical protein
VKICVVFWHLISRLNPIDWRLLDDLNKHNALVKAIREVRVANDGDGSKFKHLDVFCHSSILSGVLVNPARAYKHLHGDNMMGPFFRKFLFYHVQIAYLVLLCQTTAVVSDYYAESSSYLVTFGSIIWGLLLLVHFILFEIGIYLSLIYSHHFNGELPIAIPFFHPVSVDQIDGLYCVVNGVALSCIFTISTVDILLFMLWNVIFYRTRLRCHSLVELTSLNLDRMMELFCKFLAMICFVQFLFLHTYTSSCVMVLIWISLRILYDKLGINLPHFSFRSKRLHMFTVFVMSFLGQLLFWSEEFIMILVLASIHSIFLPRIDVLWTSLVEKRFWDYYVSINKVADFWNGLLDQSIVKMRFFQFFFVFYSSRLFYTLYVLY